MSRSKQRTLSRFGDSSTGLGLSGSPLVSMRCWASNFVSSSSRIGEDPIGVRLSENHETDIA